MNKNFKMEMKTGFSQAPKRPEKNAEIMAQVFASKMPNLTNFNNSKSNKYFSGKSCLSSNDPNHLSSSINNGLSQLEFNGMMTIKDSLLHGCKKASVVSHQRQPSNLLRVSKEILKYSEKKSSPKVFYKIPAKWVEEDVFTEDDEDTTDREDSLTNRTADIIKYDMKDSVVEVKQKIKEKLNNTDIAPEKKKNISEILRDIDLTNILKIESLYKESEMIFEKINTNNPISENIYEQYNENLSYILKVTDPINENETCSLIKEFDLFFSIEILIFSLINLLDGSFKHNQNITTGNYFQNAFKNCLFYSHQNLVIFLFVCLGENQGTTKESDQQKNIKNRVPPKKPVQEKNIFQEKDIWIKSKELIDNNRIWLNKNNYKKFLRTNNKTIKAILQNLVKEYINKSDVSNNNLNQFNQNTAITTWNSAFIYIFSYSVKNLGKTKPSKIKNEINKFFTDVKNENLKDRNLKYDVNNSEEIKINTPFLPKTKEDKIYTLVLDLDETLVHYVEEEESAYIQIRPGAENFLDEMAQHFEIVVFTAAMQDVLYIIYF
jgi:hypothetical protein